MVASILRLLAEVEFCVVWNVKLPSPVLSKVCATVPSSVMSGSLKYDLTLISISPAPLSPVLFAPKDYIATELLSSTELDFLEAELWETIQHISEINTLTIAPKDICNKLELKEKSCWQLCCAAVLDFSRPLKEKNERVEKFNKLLNQYNL